MGNQTGRDAWKQAGKMKTDKKPVGKNLSNSSSEPAGQSDSDSSDLSIQRWSAEEVVIDEGGENLFIALYDFKPCGENQLNLKKGENVTVLSHNETKEWAHVEKKSNRSVGWVPSSYIASARSYDKFTWFHGILSRNAAEYILSSGISGSFLVRDSESCPGQLTISVRCDEQYLHYKILQDSDMKFYVSPEQRFQTLDELIKFYSKEPGLAAFLQFPVGRVNKPAIFALCPEMERWEIDRNEIGMKQQLGSGQYGDVYEGTWKRHNCSVAVKTLRGDTTILTEFMKEVTIMKEMKHPNLVQLLGICTTEPPFYIITEFMCHGDLLNYLRSSSPDDVGPVTLFYMATQISSAMSYLEKKNFIHRDLAARNCLVGDHHLVKVADFGLARLMQDETYTATAGCKFPIKWTAPEGLCFSKFSIKSDVWAFGVLLWELATYGGAPYEKLELGDVYGYLESGQRMACPKGCPSEVYNLMKKCWEWEPSKRPTFREIHDTLDNMIQNSEEKKEQTKGRKHSLSTKPDSESTSVSSSSTPSPTAPASLISKLGFHIPHRTGNETAPEKAHKSKTASEDKSTKQKKDTLKLMSARKLPNEDTTGIPNSNDNMDNSRSGCQANLDTKPVLPKPSPIPAQTGTGTKHWKGGNAMSLTNNEITQMRSTLKKLSRSIETLDSEEQAVIQADGGKNKDLGIADRTKFETKSSHSTRTLPTEFKPKPEVKKKPTSEKLEVKDRINTGTSNNAGNIALIETNSGFRRQPSTPISQKPPPPIRPKPHAYIPQRINNKLNE